MATDPDEWLENVRMLTESTAAIVPDDGDLTRVRSQRSVEPGFSRDAWANIVDMGWLGIRVAEDNGGLGLGVREAVALAQVLGRGLVPEPLLPAWLALNLAEIAGFDTELEAALAGELVMVAAWQATPGGLSTEDSLQVSDGCLHGTRIAVCGGAGAEVFAVTTPEGVAMVPRHAQGLTVSNVPMHDGTIQAQLDFNQVACELRPCADTSSALNDAMVLHGGYLLGVSERAFEITLDYLRIRRQFDTAIGSFQALQHRATEIKVQLELARAAINAAATRIDLEPDTADCRLAAVRARARAGTLARLLAREVVQMHGAIGYTDEADIGLFVRKVMTEAGQFAPEYALRKRFMILRESRTASPDSAQAQPVNAQPVNAQPTNSQSDNFQSGNTQSGNKRTGSTRSGYPRTDSLAGPAHVSPEHATYDNTDTSCAPPFVADHEPHPDFNAMSDSDFRKLARNFVLDHYPDIPRFAQRRLRWPEVRPWYARLAQRGWLAPTWPQELGGMGLEAVKHLILIEEFERHGCARIHDIGTVMLGPLLMQYGSAEQKDYYLPRILRGEDIWAQGYSEPGAGSDLAALRTSATRDGDEWVINGQKTWVTLGADANQIFVLARTDSSVKKQAGISFLLVPMDAPGVTVRPIENLEGHAEFCEIFFDNVRIPSGNIVGAVNQGWTMAKALLGHERVFIGAPRLSASALSRLEALARKNHLWHEPAFADRFAALAMDLGDLNDLFESYIERLRRGEPIGPDVGVLKIFQSELYQRISEELMQVAGSLAGVRQDEDGDRLLDAAGTYLAARPTTIFGGSTEIMRNVLAVHSLNLPR